MPGDDFQAEPVHLNEPTRPTRADNFTGPVWVREAVWERLHEHAVKASTEGYAPYSGYPVGAAALTWRGDILVGSNVESASFGVTLCAECAIVSQLPPLGMPKLRLLTCVQGDTIITPCGRCRQLLFEHGAGAAPSDTQKRRLAPLVIMTPRGERAITELLPQAFSPEELGEHRPKEEDDA